MILKMGAFGERGVKNYISQRIDYGHSEGAVGEQTHKSIEFLPSWLFTLNEIMYGMHITVQLAVKLQLAEFFFAMILEIGNNHEKNKKYTEKVKENFFVQSHARVIIFLKEGSFTRNVSSIFK